MEKEFTGAVKESPFMKIHSALLFVCLSLTAPFFQYELRADAQTPQTEAAAAGKSVPVEGHANVVRERVAGGLRYPGAMFIRLTGRVKVVNAHTLVFGDGTEVELNGAIDMPEPEQKGLIGETFYPCGKEAADFLGKLIGEQPVICLASSKQGNKLQGDCFIGETSLEIELVRNGWAIAHHAGMESWEIIAREKKRGLWRGKFVAPERWRKGDRLPGE
jgi:endonuclease YncB( thermonuclease family)